MFPSFQYNSTNYAGKRVYCAFLQPLDTPDRIVAVCLVDIEQLFKVQSQKIRYSEMTMTLLNEQGDLLFCDGEIPNSSDLQIERNLNIGDLKLGVSIPKSELFRSVKNFSNIFTAATILMVLIVLILSWVLSRFLYQPIQELLNHVPPQNGKNEFESFQNTYSALQVEYQNTVQSREEALHRLKQTQIAACMKKELVSEDHELYYMAVFTNKEAATYWASVCALSSSEIIVFPQRTAVVWKGHILNAKRGLSKTLSEVIGMATKARPLSELSESYAEASFCLEMGLLSASPDINLICLEDLPRFFSPNIYKEVEQWIFTTRDELSDLLETLFPPDLPVEICGQRLFTVIVLLLQTGKSTFEQWQDIADRLAFLRDNLTCHDAISLLLQYMTFFFSSRMKDQIRVVNDLQRVKELDRYIYAHYSELISLDSAAEFIGVSRQKVCELMREAHGITFVNFLNQYRVEKAKQLLSETESNIETVSSAVGFSSNSYFIKVFKNLTGLTPGEYRKFLSDEKG